jgi:hypothetical protein
MEAELALTIAVPSKLLRRVRIALLEHAISFALR